MGLSVIGAFSVLQNTILGPGLLGLPWAFAQCGFGAGLVFLVLSGIVAFLGMHLLSACAGEVAPKLRSADTLDMAAICKHANAKMLQQVWDVAMVVSCGGALISSLMIIGDSLEHLDIRGMSRETWIIMVFSLLAFPLSCLKSLTFLRFSSCLSFGMILYITSIILVTFIKKDIPEYSAGGVAESGGINHLRTDNLKGMLQAVPIFTFCFCGHMSMLPVANELTNSTLSRLDAVITSALVTAGAVYGIVAVCAYLSFGNITPQDLLHAYEDNFAMRIARVGIAIVCTSFYPLLLQPIRRTLQRWALQCIAGVSEPKDGGLLHRDRDQLEDGVTDYGAANGAAGGMKAHHSAGHVESSTTITSWVAPPHSSESIRTETRSPYILDLVLHTVLTFMIGGTALAIALSTKSLGKVFSLVGATGFAFMCNICPAWAYLLVTPRKCVTAVFAWMLLAFGLLSSPLCVAANLI
jgi:amino acid permease